MVKEIADLERKRDAAWFEYLHLCNRIDVLKEKPITPLEREASLKVCRSIGRNVSHRAWQKKEGA